MADTIDDKLTKLLSGVTALTTRLDAVEKEHKLDADTLAKMMKDCVHSEMDSVAKRLDSLEKHRKDSEEKEESERKEREDKARKDKARKDAEEKALEEEREKNGLKRNDGESDEEYEKRVDKHRKDKARKDAAEKERAEKEEKDRADAARKDAEEKERHDREEKERHDAQEARIRGLEAQLAAVTQHMKDVSSEDRIKLAAVWSQDEKLCQLFGDSAKGVGPDKWWPGETPAAYERRVASKYKKHSAKWKDVELSNITDDATFANVAAEIYNDAQAAAMRGAGAPAGALQRVEIVDPYSHSRRIEWRGDDEGATWHQFANPLKIGKFSVPSKS